MTANAGPMDELWIEVPATSSAEDLARAVDEFPPGTEGRYYLIHMDLMAGRVDFADALTRRGYKVTTSDILRRYAFGMQKEHFAVFWLGDDRAPGETANPRRTSHRRRERIFLGAPPDGACVYGGVDRGVSPVAAPGRALVTACPLCPCLTAGRVSAGGSTWTWRSRSLCGS
jgi:hypothetical protein